MTPERPDWGIEDQRLAAMNRRVGRWALRAELAILAGAAMIGAIAAPVLVKNVILGVALAAAGALS